MKLKFISPDVILDSISKKASSSELAFPETYKPAPALRIQISLRESWMVLLKIPSVMSLDSSGELITRELIDDNLKRYSSGLN